MDGSSTGSSSSNNNNNIDDNDANWWMEELFGSWGDADNADADNEEDAGTDYNWYTSTFDPATEDPEFPGAFPTESNNAVVINIRTDEFPFEIRFTWSRYAGDQSWETLESATMSNYMSISFYEQTVEPGNLYRLRITDVASDGICCAYGFGWVSITNGTASEEYADGTVVWSQPGIYTNQLTVFIWVDNDGMAHHVEYLPGEGYALATSSTTVSSERTVVVPLSELTSTSNAVSEQRQQGSYTAYGGIPGDAAFP